jgi:hypothetical protein
VREGSLQVSFNKSKYAARESGRCSRFSPADGVYTFSSADGDVNIEFKFKFIK